MLVVKIESWPHGDERAKKILGQIEIHNVGGLPGPFADYTAYFEMDGNQISRVALPAHDRTTGPWPLVRRAVMDLLVGRRTL